MALFKFVKNIIEKKKIYIYNFGNHVRDFTYIDDIVNGIVLTTFFKKIFYKKFQLNANLTPDQGICKFKILNIGSGKRTSLKKYIKIIERIKNKFNKRIFTFTKRRYSRNTFKYSEFKKLGYEPKTNPENGIKKFIKWYKNIIR